MCGIAGTSIDASNRICLNERLASSLVSMRNRGPNGEGSMVWEAHGKVVGFAHRRLSVIDLSVGGHQPMDSPTGRYSITFNGEIYNYLELRSELTSLGVVFHTSSDTEVLLMAWCQWKRECLTRLVGMFAFAVLDRVECTVTLVRDGFGIKPIYYSHDEDGSFSFASDPPALLAVSGAQCRANPLAVHAYFTQGAYDTGAQTFFLGLQRLPAGNWLEFSIRSGSVKGGRWWTPDVSVDTTVDFDEAADQVRHAFLANVRLHLRSDVPLGAALSGGIDSSALVCALRYLEPDAEINTFSFVAPGSNIDESRWMDIVNRRVGAIPHLVSAAPTDLFDDLQDLVRAQGEPFGSTSIYAQYRVFRVAREHGITVMLDGQGADECLGGYFGYPAARMRSLFSCGDISGLARFVRGWGGQNGRSNFEAIYWLLQAIWGARGKMATAHLHRAKRSHRLLAPDWTSNCSVADPFVEGLDPEIRGRQLAETLRIELQDGGLGVLLRHEDRNSMRWSIESRVPYLTTRFAEQCLRLPEHFLVGADGQSKRILRAALRGLVPDDILNRKDKVGFAAPQLDWIRAMPKHLATVLEGVREIPALDFNACRAEIVNVVDGRTQDSRQVWRLICFATWWHSMALKG